MSRTSVISHPPLMPVVIIRAEYRAICGLDDPTAIVLNLFEHLTNIKIASDRTDDPWIYKSVKEMQDDLLYIYSENTLSKAVDNLVAFGYLERRRNPRNKMDKTWQYKLVVSRVQAHINAWFEALLKNAESIPQFCGMHSLKLRDALLKIGEAIPEVTTEESPEIKEKDIAAALPSVETAVDAIMQDASNIVDSAFEKTEAKTPKVKAAPVSKKTPDIDPEFKKLVNKSFRAYGNHANGIAEMLQGKATKGEYSRNNIDPGMTLDELKAYVEYRVTRRGGMQYIPQKIVTIQSSILEWRDTPDYTHWQRRMAYQQRVTALPVVAAPAVEQTTEIDTSSATRERMYQDPFGGN